MKFMVLGTGSIGRIIAMDLARRASCGSVVVADYKLQTARAVARELGNGVRAFYADANDVRATAELFRAQDTFVVVHAGRYRLNTKVMEAAYRARVHYIDMGGLYDQTLKQLRWHQRFLRKGLLALLGCGEAPGTSNALAEACARRLKETREVHVRYACLEGNRYAGGRLPLATYSPETISDELTKLACVFRRGRMLAAGRITARGTLHANQALPIDEYLAELRRRGMGVYLRTLQGWGYKA